MTFTSRTVLVAAIICSAVLAPEEAQAQQAMSARPYESVFAREIRENPVPQAVPRGSRAVMTGALIGAGGALALTAMAAAKYGENEGGSFCTRCMMQWLAVSVPIGAGIGAVIGYGIKRSRRSIAAAPIFTRRSAGVVIAARF